MSQIYSWTNLFSFHSLLRSLLYSNLNKRNSTITRTCYQAWLWKLWASTEVTLCYLILAHCCFGLLKLIMYPVLANISAVHITASRAEVGETSQWRMLPKPQVTLCQPLPDSHMLCSRKSHINIIDEHLDNQRHKQNTKIQKKNSSMDSIFHAYNKYLSISWLWQKGIHWWP